MKPRPAANTRSFRRAVRLLVLATAGAALLTPTASASTHIVARCAGDVLSGTMHVSRGSPSARVQLAVLAKRNRQSGFTSTGMSTWMNVDGGRSYPFRFDIGRLSAMAYRVDPPGDHGNTVPAASCAPGHQVPEAPLALLLPVSVLGLAGLLFARRRRLSAES